MTRTQLTKALFLLYLLLLIWILIFKLGVRFHYMDERHINFIPFGKSDAHDGSTSVSEFVMNVLVFVPMGIYLAVLSLHSSVASVAGISALSSLLLESFQYVFRIGAFDITDIFTNTMGGVLGYLLFSIAARWFKSHAKAHRWFLVLALPGTLLIILLLTLLRLGMLPVRYQ